MKQIFFVMLVFLYSCTTSYQSYHKIECNKSTKEVFNEISSQLIKMDFKLQDVSKSIGLLEMYLDVNEDKFLNPFPKSYRMIWTFKEDNGSIIAIAKELVYNEYGNLVDTYYCNENTSKSSNWYWKTREKLESICGNKIKIVTWAR